METVETEVVAPGKSSQHQEVRGVKSKNFAKKLRDMARTDSPVAIFTESPDSRMPYYTKPREEGKSVKEKEFRYFPLRVQPVDVSLQNFHRFVQEKREETYRLYNDKLYDDDECAERVSFYNAVEKTVIAILKEYRGYEVTVVMAYHNPKGRNINRQTHSMHTDDRFEKQNTINIVATFEGQSTQFEGKDKRVIRVPNSSMTGFPGGGIAHRSPSHGAEERLALIIELRSQFKTKR